ncbi:hypothetical protein PAEPH01_1635 [Pancytospora epiphaga]|nr:hypothetical protein PAEPH01_1635 [Pancytospora epiphaga]
MQYIIGREVLEKQLDNWEGCRDSQFREEIGEAFKLLFYNNGNYLSIQYSGTPALLVSHVLGRSFLSKVWDGYFSVKRYFINRLVHGYLQNSYDILCGNRQEGPLHDTRKKFFSVAWGFAICVVFPRLLFSNNILEFVLVLFAVLIFIYLFLMSVLDFPL